MKRNLINNLAESIKNQLEQHQTICYFGFAAHTEDGLAYVASLTRANHDRALNYRTNAAMYLLTRLGKESRIFKAAPQKTLDSLSRTAAGKALAGQLMIMDRYGKHPDIISMVSAIT